MFADLNGQTVVSASIGAAIWLEGCAFINITGVETVNLPGSVIQASSTNQEVSIVTLQRTSFANVSDRLPLLSQVVFSRNITAADADQTFFTDISMNVTVSRGSLLNIIGKKESGSLENAAAAQLRSPFPGQEVLAIIQVCHRYAVFSEYYDYPASRFVSLLVYVVRFWYWFEPYHRFRFIVSQVASFKERCQSDTHTYALCHGDVDSEACCTYDVSRTPQPPRFCCGHSRKHQLWLY